MMTRAFLTLVIGELPDSTDRRLTHRDGGISEIALHHRSRPPGHLVGASRSQRLDLDDVAQHGDADELAGRQRRSKLGPIELDRGGDTRKNLTRRSPRPWRPGASSRGMNSDGSAGNSTAARNTPSFDPK